MKVNGGVVVSVSESLFGVTENAVLNVETAFGLNSIALSCRGQVAQYSEAAST